MGSPWLVTQLLFVLLVITVQITVSAHPGDGAPTDEMLNAIKEAQESGLDLPLSSPPEPVKKEKQTKVRKKKSAKKKSATDWNKLNINDMTEDWEVGDDEDELEHEYERIQRIAAEKAEKARKALKSGNQKKIKKAMDSGAMDTKGGMMFVTLTDNQMDGSPWDMKVQDLLCGRWTALLRTASLQANLYNMEPGQVLLQVDKGWMFNDVVRFIMQQPEVVKGYKDGKDYYPSMYTDDDEL